MLSTRNRLQTARSFSKRGKHKLLRRRAVKARRMIAKRNTMMQWTTETSSMIKRSRTTSRTRRIRNRRFRLRRKSLSRKRVKK